jgi:hypothetical protein
LGTLLCVAAPSPAWAQPPPRIAFQLDYVLGPRGEQLCPNAAEMRDAIRADFGYDPVRDDATWRVTVAVNPGLGRTIQATMELRDPTGNVVWKDHKKAINDDCDTLVSGVALSIRISIDHRVPPIEPKPEPAAPEPKPEPEPTASEPVVPKPAPATPEQAPDAPAARPDSKESSEPPATRPKVRAGLGTTFAVGDAPDASFGVSAQVGIRWSIVSISLEGRGDIQPEDGGLETGRISGAVLPCGHYGVLFGCALGTVGRQSASYEKEEDSAWYGGGGVRAGVELPVVDPLALRLSGELVATTPTGSMNVGAMERWSSPTISGVVTAGIVADF